MAGKHTDIKHLVTDLLEDAGRQTSLTHEEYEEESVTLPSKEHEPMTNREQRGVEQAVEHEPEAELALHLEARQEIPKIDKELIEEGVTATPTTAFPTYEEVKLPLSDEKVVAGLEEPVTSSWRWLAELCMYLLRVAHQTIKSVHGKVMRVAIEK